MARTGSFETDLNRASKQAARRAKEIDAAFAKVGKAIGASLVLAAGVAAAAFKQTVNRMDELSKAAQRANMPTEQFSALAYAGELADVAMQDLQSSMGKLAKAQGDAARGLKEQKDAFDALGIAFKNSDGSLRNTSDVFREFADRFQEFKGSPEIVALGMQLFGRSFQKLIPLLKDGSKGLKEAEAEARAFGIVVGDEAGRAAEAFNDNLTRLGKPLQGIFQRITTEVLPSMVALGDEFVRTAKETKALDEASKIGVTGLRLLASVGVGVGAAFMVTGEAIATVVTALTLLAKGEFKAAIAAAKIGAGELETIIERTKDFMGAIWNPPDTPAPVGASGGGPSEDRLRKLAAALAGGGKAVKSEADKAAEAVAKMLRKIQDDVDRFGMDEHQVKLRELFDMGATPEQLDAAHKLLSTLDRYRQASEAVAEAEEVRLDLLRQSAAYTKSLETQADAWLDLIDPMREFIRQVEKVDEMVDRQLLTPDQAEAIKKTFADIGKEISKVDEFALEAARNIQDALGQTMFDVLDGNFDNIGKSFANMLKRMIAEAAAANLARELLGDFTKTGKVGGWLGQGLAALGRLFGGTRADGGPVLAGRAYLVGERGPEVIVPNTSGTVIPNHAVSAGGGITMAPSFTINGEMTRSQEARLMTMMRNVAVATMADSRRRAMA